MMYIDGILVARELKALRERKDKSIIEACNELGIHTNTLYKYERDANDMNLGLLEKLLKYYSVDELIFFKTIREYNHSQSEV